MVLVEPDEGAWTSIFAAASPEVRKDAQRYHGSYLVPVGQASKASRQAEDPQLAEDLWRVSEEALEKMQS